MIDNLTVNRLVTLHNANHHNIGLGSFAKSRDGKALWQPLAKQGLIDKGSAQFCGVISITRKGRELLTQAHDQIAAAFGLSTEAVNQVLSLPFDGEN